MDRNKRCGKPIARRMKYAFVVFWLNLFLSGCSPQLPTLHQLSALPEAGICRVAVLPFINESDFPEGGTIFYRVFTSELTKYGDFEITPEGDVREAFRKARVTPGLRELELEKLRIIGNYLNVDVLIEGTIIELREDELKGEILPFMSVNIQIIDAATGRMLWSTYHRREGEEYRKILHFGIVNTTTRLARRVSAEIIKRWIAEGLFLTCAE